MSESQSCPSCGSTKISRVRMPSYHTHHAALKCGECDCFLQWGPKPATISRQKQRQQTISKLLQAQGLTNWEREFLENLQQTKKLSPRQQETLSRIEAKLGGKHLSSS